MLYCRRLLNNHPCGTLTNALLKSRTALWVCLSGAWIWVSTTMPSSGPVGNRMSLQILTPTRLPSKDVVPANKYTKFVQDWRHRVKTILRILIVFVLRWKERHKQSLLAQIIAWPRQAINRQAEPNDDYYDVSQALFHRDIHGLSQWSDPERRGWSRPLSHHNETQQSANRVHNSLDVQNFIFHRFASRALQRFWRLQHQAGVFFLFSRTHTSICTSIRAIISLNTCSALNKHQPIADIIVTLLQEPLLITKY